MSRVRTRPAPSALPRYSHTGPAARLALLWPTAAGIACLFLLVDAQRLYLVLACQLLQLYLSTRYEFTRRA